MMRLFWQVPLTFSMLAAAACEKAPDATRISSATETVAQPTVGETLIGRGALTVTHGAVGAAPGDVLQVREPEVRAVATQVDSDEATLSFTYLGPTEKSAPLTSGQIRRQVGLKLHANDGCNLIYVMWRLEPVAELVVSLKENPGQRTHAECGAHGYRNVTGDRTVSLPEVVVGATHALAARLDGERLSVRIDGGTPVTYVLDPSAAALHGPVGFRTDNARVDLTLSAGPSSGPPPPATDTAEDD